MINEAILNELAMDKSRMNLNSLVTLSEFTDGETDVERRQTICSKLFSPIYSPADVRQSCVE